MFKRMTTFQNMRFPDLCFYFDVCACADVCVCVSVCVQIIDVGHAG